MWRGLKMKILSFLYNFNQDGSVQRLHNQHSPLWQRNVGKVLQTGGQTEQLPHALPPPHPQHSVERQSAKCSGPRTCWSLHHVYATHDQTTQAAMTRPRAPNGEWPHTQGYLLRRTCLW